MKLARFLKNLTWYGLLASGVTMISYGFLTSNSIKQIKYTPQTPESGKDVPTSKRNAGQLLNVVFMQSDDLRPEMTSLVDTNPAYNARIHTPNIDRLAATSLVLRRTYTQAAFCNPSRTSMLTSRRPDTTGVLDLETYFRRIGKNFTTLPQYFKQHGYRTLGMGKVFHQGHASNDNDPPSWTESFWLGHIDTHHHWRGFKRSWLAVKAKHRRRHPLPDDLIVGHATERLKELGEAQDVDEKPFYMSIGFLKPHLPFVFPEEFQEYYPKEEIPMPTRTSAPQYMPEIAWKKFGPLRSFEDIAKHSHTGDVNSSFPDPLVLSLRRAYYSSVSYLDSLIGRVLDTLDEVGLANRTIVSLVADHGFQLGENGAWGKATNFELATHVPWILKIPGITDRGILTDQLTELVDVFPTVSEAAGLPSIPPCPPDSSSVSLCREGDSILPLIHTPHKTWKQHVFSQIARPDNRVGYSVRNSRFRYTEWVNIRYWEGGPPRWGSTIASELYDYVRDPGETVNYVADPSYSDVITDMKRLLKLGYVQS